MRWMGMPMAMWAVFARSFQTQLTAVLGYDAATAKQITKTAKPPIAMLTLARARAWVSLIPSPTIATCLPSS